MDENRYHTHPGDTIILVPDIVNKLRDEDFGEGMSPRSANEFVLLTWKERRVYTISRNDMSTLQEFELDN